VEEWKTHIENAKVFGAKYITLKMDKDTVVTFKPLVAMQQWATDSQKKTIKWGKVKEVQFDSNEPRLVKYRYNFREPSATLDVTKRRGRQVNLSAYQPELLYDDMIPLKPKKIRDLKYLVNTHAIPSKYHDFYLNYIRFSERKRRPGDANCRADPEGESDAAPLPNDCEDESDVSEPEDGEDLPLSSDSEQDEEDRGEQQNDSREEMDF
jgi:hypothetical protein